jgi:hypothetical protein
MFARLFFFAALTLSFFCGVAFPAAASAEDYTKATWADLSRTLVRFNALTLDEAVLLDEYTIITECDLYKAFYHDDFKWNKVRQAVLTSLAMNVATYPTSYRYDVDLQLDRYDFAAKVFNFTEKSRLRNVNTFMLYSVEGNGCGASDVKFLPRTFRAVIPTPIYLDGLPLSESDAADFLKQMNLDANLDRIVHARFNLRVVGIDPIHKITFKSGADLITMYVQSKFTIHDKQSVLINVRLDSIDFFEDPQMTKLVYEMKF